MQLTIPTTPRKYFHMAMELLRSVPPLNTLTPKAISILAEILYWDYYYRDLDKEIRWKMVFDYDTKLKIMDNVPCDRQSLYNNISLLKKAGIVDNNTIKTNFGLNPDNPSITFNFKINE